MVGTGVLEYMWLVEVHVLEYTLGTDLSLNILQLQLYVLEYVLGTCACAWIYVLVHVLEHLVGTVGNEYILGTGMLQCMVGTGGLDSAMDWL